MELDRSGLVLFHDYTKGHAQDLSGNGNNGTLQAGEGFIKTENGYGYTAGTTGSRLSVSHAPSLVFDAITIAICLRLQNVATPFFLDKRSAGNGDFTLYISAGLTIQLWVGPAFANFTALTQAQADYLDTLIVTKPAGNSAAKLFVNGAYASSSIAIALGNVGAPLYIGNNYSSTYPSRNKHYAVMLYNVEKSAAQVADIHSFLVGLKSPNSRTRNFYTGPSRHAGEPGMVSGWNMVPNSSGKIADVKSANHGTPTGVLTSKTPWGESCLMLPQKPIACGAATNCGFVGKTYGTSKWICVNSLPAGNRIVFSRGNWATQGYEIFALAGSTFQVYEYNGATQSTGTVPFALNRWYQLGMLSVNGGRLFIATNGALVGAGTVKSFAHAYNAAHPLVMGGRGTDPATYADITLCSPSVGEFASQAEFEAYFKAEYNRVASALIYRENFESAPVGYTAIGSGSLPGTELQILNGTFKISVDTVFGKLQKVLECVTVGSVLVPIPIGNEAFGTFEYWHRANTANWATLGFLQNKGSYDATGQNGYSFGYGGTSCAFIGKVTAGVTTTVCMSAAGYAAPFVWHKYSLSNTTESLKSLYMDNQLVSTAGGSGTNPTTDATHTTAKYLVQRMNAGDKLALIQKKFGAPV